VNNFRDAYAHNAMFLVPVEIVANRV